MNPEGKLSERKSAAAPMEKVNHFAFVDALRGVAALYVMALHIALIPAFKPAIPEALHNIILSGGSGVTLFFVISAFTLSYSMRERGGEPRPILAFYLRRIFRIVPLFYAWVLIAILINIHFLHLARPPLRLIALNVMFLFNFSPGTHNGIVWGSWTLGVEMMFYLIFPFIFLWCDGIRKAAAFVGLALLGSLGFYRYLLSTNLPAATRESYFYTAFANHLPVFGLGVLTFLVFERYIWRKTHSKVVGSITLASSTALWFLASKPPMTAWRWYLLAVAYAVLACGLGMMPVKAVVNRLTLFYGRISYSLYLNHLMVVFALSPVYKWIYGLPLGTWSAFFSCFALTLGIVTPLSWLTYQWIERPGNRAGRWLIKKYLARREAGTGTLVSGTDGFLSGWRSAQE